jgi:hypothetical protein
LTNRFRFIRENLNIRLWRKTLVYVFRRLIIDSQHRYNPIAISIRAVNPRVLPANIVHMNSQASGPLAYLSAIADIFVNSGHAIISPQQEATQQLGIVCPTMEKGRRCVNEILLTEIKIAL